jgi:hypothetical protein
MTSPSPTGGLTSPEPDRLHTDLMALAEGPSKIVAGLVVLMMKEPQKVRDREWLMEAYTHIAAQALEMGDARLQELQEIIRTERDSVLNLSFQLFMRVAEDAAALGGTPTLAQASMMALAYFSDGPSPTFEAVEPEDLDGSPAGQGLI